MENYLMQATHFSYWASTNTIAWVGSEWVLLLPHFLI